VELFDTTQNALSAALRGADARQSALAGNLANVDTPGYLRKDVDFNSALQAALGSGADPSNVGFSAQTDPSAPVRADGNSVDIDRENAELSENALEYDALARVAATRIDILKTAMGVQP
jgi:flagellar basal-body rod protein FlgB